MNWILLKMWFILFFFKQNLKNNFKNTFGKEKHKINFWIFLFEVLKLLIDTELIFENLFPSFNNQNFPLESYKKNKAVLFKRAKNIYLCTDFECAYFPGNSQLSLQNYSNL